jgi:hypothetical protein
VGRFAPPRFQKSTNEAAAVKEITRSIGKKVERDLWARAAGRCQFQGCNKLLYKSSVTQQTITGAERAHIYSFGKGGPRGQGPYAEEPEKINELGNLLLVCHECHETIDGGNVDLYPAVLLRAWKLEHEQRVETVTGIAPDKKSHVVLYGANIGAEQSHLDFKQCATAMFPRRYPANHRPEILSMSGSHRDHGELYWAVEPNHLRTGFNEIRRLIAHDAQKHFSVFALAPQPLLVLLGTLFTDRIQVDTYQLHREPAPGWAWHPTPTSVEYSVIPPSSFEHPPVLIISLSAHVSTDRVHAAIGDKVSIWQLTIDEPHNDFLKSEQQLSLFRTAIRKMMDDIKHKHGSPVSLSIFPAMPVACAVELGRARMPKANMPWVLYDQSNVTRSFIETITIKGDEHV